tara:strand:+ start:1320 stop:2357 length:1038 start_codon:yes stop_codon:yes gene_type:complete
MSKFNGASTGNFGGNSPAAIGGFSPEIFSQRVLMFFRTASVVEGITNSDYYGELASFGDSVRIMLEPKLSVKPYTRGASIQIEELEDNDVVIEIDKANHFAFQIDDIEDKLSHISWESLATSSATFALKNSYDRDVLKFMSQGAQAANIVNGGTHVTAQETPNVITLGHGAGETDPLNLLSLLSLKLDEAEVPEEGRYVVVSPRFMELLARTDSKLLSTDYNQGEGGLKNGLAMTGKLRGFSLYKTNNSPRFLTDSTGSAEDQAEDDGQQSTGTNVVIGGDDSGAVNGDVVLAGHMSACATVSSIDKVEKIRAESTFADLVRGLHVYGRAIIRPEALAVAYVVYA